MHQVLLPKMGNSVEEALIVRWLKQEGDTVREGEPLFVIQTDKAEVECEATASGVLRKILAPEGSELPVMTVVALIGTEDEPLPDAPGAGSSASAARETSVLTQAQPEVVAPSAAASSSRPSGPASAVPSAGDTPPVSPRARRIAEAKHVPLAGVTGSGVGGRILSEDVLAVAESIKATPVARREAERAGIDLRSVQGTGPGGKITRDDVLAHEGSGTIPEAAPVVAVPSAASGDGEVKRIPLTPMRKVIARRMRESKFTAPHYYVTVEVDMQAAKAFRSGLKFKASFNDLVLYATMKALRLHPEVNVRWTEDAMEQVSDINLGMAVALPTGLIVPVIRRAQLLSLEGLCAVTRDLAERAQKGKLLPDDYTGNTFTVSNLGAFGVDHFTAIINQPDSAILAVGQIKDRVVVMDGGIHIRPIMKLTMSSDHRVIDGAVAARFLADLKQILEAADF
ncbi:MAG: 2-oxo acid dehydrogenase subunit E2 [Candidatus Hydrogenedentes bacterium]|nr:2-oxo acid dehydrogenase subunit E2 [Candidatus Hydrogenedentota bacterium]